MCLAVPVALRTVLAAVLARGLPNESENSHFSAACRLSVVGVVCVRASPK